MIKVFIDDKPFKISNGFTILQSCALGNVELPRFCYHDKLKIAGNCRICLVEVTGSKKLVASCAAQITEFAKIYTNTIRVRVARQNVLEFLLANHPLDCPICDQGGECDLQDITTTFGADRGRFYESAKRAVLNKNIGPLVRTSMNRCIHCTRCVRFISLISGSPQLGMLNRGSSSEIGGYVDIILDDPLSGNVIDLCPVGALTSKPFAFKARTWELNSVRTIDIFDTMHSTILLDIASNQICRVLPYANAKLNEDWITNRARFSYDGVFNQRLYYCLLILKSFYFFRIGPGIFDLIGFDVFYRISWSVAAAFLCGKLFKIEVWLVSLLYGPLLDLITCLGATKYLHTMGISSSKAWDYGATSNAFNFYVKDWEFLFFFNTSLHMFSDVPSICFLISVNLKFEQPILAFKLSQIAEDYYMPFYSIGAGGNYLGFQVKNISNNLLDLINLAAFKNRICVNFYNKEFSLWPFIFVSNEILTSMPLYSAVISFLKNLNYASDLKSLRNFLAFSYNIVNKEEPFTIDIFSSIFNVSTYPKSLTLLLAGVTPRLKDFIETDMLRTTEFVSVNYMLGFDDPISYSSIEHRLRSWKIYQGSYGVGLAFFADLILPVSTFVERIIYYKNFLGELSSSAVALTYNEAYLRGDLKDDYWAFSFFSKYYSQFAWCLIFDLSRPIIGYNYSLDIEIKNFTNSFVSFWAYKAFFKKFDFSGKVFYSKFLRFFLMGNHSSSMNMWIHLNRIYPVSSESFLAVRSKFFLALPANYSVMNYYSDNTINSLKVSKTMVTSANFFFKKNFSFSSKLNNYV